MPFTIDAQLFDKTIRWPVNHGYDLRSSQKIRAILVHSTNGVYGSTFENEARFLRDTPKVSAHFLISKTGRIVCIVPPSFRAWHAGEVSPPAFSNDTSIGIETHFTAHEIWPALAHDALTWLVKQLIAQYGITEHNIETHRKVAIPPGRKIDPSNYTDQQFYAWRHALFVDPTPPVLAPIQQFVVISPDALNVRQGPGVEFPIVKRLAPGTVVWVDVIKDNGWCHLAKAPDHNQDDIGFVSGAWLKAVM